MQGMLPAPLLVLGVGNPSRGDDALGPLFVERLETVLASEVASGAVELLTDFQLQIEHALDLAGRARVVLVDASTSASPPFEFAPASPRRDTSHSTHALSPEALLDAHRALAVADAEVHAHLGQAPETWVLAIRGERFELGEPLSPAGRAHLDAALDFFVADMRGRGGGVAGRQLDVEGTVQGVGFRPWAHRIARRLGLAGCVYNTSEGVSIQAYGDKGALDALVRAVQQEAPEEARVRLVRARPLVGPAPSGFTIAASRADVERGAARALGPDLATCEACAREVTDPASRRHGYAFTSCSACGPRLAIAHALPYDRAATTMAGFALCAHCAREHADPDDRRFHAQTVACPSCGPRLWLAGPTGAELTADARDPIAAAAARLRAGQILGVQGLGAFHLVCDATNAGAVERLRRGKRRDLQPLAVMVRDEAMADALTELDEAARAALRSRARPIVLAPSRADPFVGIVPAVNGPSRRTGVLLPYTPLHALLTAAVGRPLVVTSGNPSGGPAAIDHAGARSQLGAVVDAFLLHDQPIERRVEDSVVARAAGGGVRVVRRSRGLAPVPMRLPLRARAPILALGGHMKNTACLVVGDQAFLTPHLGDLGYEESDSAWRRDVEGFERLFGVRADVLAHDLHPDYASTRYALDRPATRRVGVQHHVAHALAVVAELQIDEPVVSLVLDGTGWGHDGTAWGAELLLIDGARWIRAASFRPLALPGGEAAIREVWRAALAALIDTHGEDQALALAARLPAFAELPPASLATVARMVEAGVGTVRARGLGRWFDALGALVLGLPRAGFDGHVALALEEEAGSAAAPPYPVTLPAAMAEGGPITDAHEVDLRPTVRAAVAERLAGAPAALVSARFHRTVIDATTEIALRALAATGLRRVVLSGGCFQNRILERGLIDRLGAERVAIARHVPVNDGGLALGQAFAAALALAAGTS
jgi:hydrogenase maturation protein HypF